MLGIAILFSLCCPFRSAVPAILAAPYARLPVSNDLGDWRPKGFEFYEALAKQRATLLKADGKDILSVKMHLNGEK